MSSLSPRRSGIDRAQGNVRRAFIHEDEPARVYALDVTPESASSLLIALGGTQ